MNAVLQYHGGPGYGDTLITCATIDQSYMMLITSPMLGITGGSQPLISFNYGANKPERIRKIVFCVLMLCIGFTSFMFLVSRFLPAAFAGIFTMMIIPLSLQYTFVDSLTALGMTGLSLFLSLFRKTTYFVATCLLPFAFTAASAFYAEPIADGIAALTSTTAFAIVYMKYLKGTGSLMEIGTGRGQAA